MADSAATDGVAHEKDVLPSVEESVDEVDLLREALSPPYDVHLVKPLRSQHLFVHGHVRLGLTSVEPWSGEHVRGGLGHPLGSQERQGPLAHQLWAGNRKNGHHELAVLRAGPQYGTRRLPFARHRRDAVAPLR